MTSADFGGRSKKGLRAVERQRVHALFDEIQIAIYDDDRARLEVLMVRLALTTASHGRTELARAECCLGISGLPCSVKWTLSPCPGPDRRRMA